MPTSMPSRKKGAAPHTETAHPQRRREADERILREIRRLQREMQESFKIGTPLKDLPTETE